MPVTVRGLTTSQTERLRIPGHASSSVRVVFEDQPESVEVNDGSVPEVRTTRHTVELKGGGDRKPVDQGEPAPSSGGVISDGVPGLRPSDWR